MLGPQRQPSSLARVRAEHKQTLTQLETMPGYKTLELDRILDEPKDELPQRIKLTIYTKNGLKIETTVDSTEPDLVNTICKAITAFNRRSWRRHEPATINIGGNPTIIVAIDHIAAVTVEKL